MTQVQAQQNRVQPAHKKMLPNKYKQKETEKKNWSATDVVSKTANKCNVCTGYYGE